jgi:hypothetical protein
MAAQGRTIHKLIASLSKHPIPILQFRWEQIYVLLSRITGGDNMRPLLKMRNGSMLDYVSDLEKDPFTTFYFAGFGNNSSSNVPLRWDKALAAQAAGFLEK